MKNALQKRETKLGPEVVSHKLTVFDPLQVFAPGGALHDSGAALKTPHHFFKDGTAPAAMTEMQKAIQSADCYVIVSCEYNHTIPPGLTGMMGHFAGANYAYKPSAIVCYSSGTFGGARAAVALRPFLSELGCLPVSKLTLLPNPPALLKVSGMTTYLYCSFQYGRLLSLLYLTWIDGASVPHYHDDDDRPSQEDGTPVDPAAGLLQQLPSTLSELEWLAVAMRAQRERSGPPPPT